MPFEISSNDEITYINNYIDGIVDMVNNGDIPIKRINESVTRILKLKKKYGLLITNEYNDNIDLVIWFINDLEGWGKIMFSRNPSGKS